jgi:hypothetical protein
MLLDNDLRRSRMVAENAPAPDTVPDAAAVREQLERILKSPMFRNSQRYTAFLTFCVHRTLAGEGDSLKERNIGIEVFGRSADYDTSSDHVVRSAASEIRKRLAQYYQESGTEPEIRIGLQAGSYVPQFLSPKEEAKAVPAQPTTPNPVRDSRRRTAAIVGAVAVVLAIVYGAYALTNRPSVLDQFWKPVLSSGGPVVLCVGGSMRGDPRDDRTDSVTVGESHRLDGNQVNYGSAITLALLTGLVQSHGKQVLVMRRSATRFSDLRQGPAVLIGAYNNEWAMRLAGSLRFGFDRKPGGSAVIRDRLNPSNNDWALDFSMPVRQLTRDYALVSRVYDPKTERPTILVAGIGYWGTMAAGEFVTNREQIEKIRDSAPGGWEKKNIEIVLSTDVIDGLPGPPKVLATHFW